MKNRSTEDAVLLWQKLLLTLSDLPQEVKTVSKTGSTAEGKWFYVNAVGDALHVDEAKTKIPSSKLANTRVITKVEFMALYPNYYKWRTGVMSREQAKGNSLNSSYIFALINKFDV